MKNYSHFLIFSIAIFIYFVPVSVWGKAVHHNISTSLDDPSANSDEFKNTTDLLDCDHEEHALEDVIVQENRIFLISKNLTIYPDKYEIKEKSIRVCPNTTDNTVDERNSDCPLSFSHKEGEFEILQNNSALILGHIVEPNSYRLIDNVLYRCAPDYEYYEDYQNQSDNQTESNEKAIPKDASIIVSQTGSGISIIALIIYLIAFCFSPALNNLPGYNLASLSVAFLIAYSLLLIGQIPAVVGLSCVISGALQHNFFLSAFFWMNVLAFDVWKTLRIATKNLRIISENTRKKKFLLYSLYAWGCPLAITSLSVIFDYSDKIPDKYKPKYGYDEYCVSFGSNAKLIFFTAPSLSLFIVNAFFFGSSFWMLSRNKMKCTSDQDHQTVKYNYTLFLRLAIMMGMSWLLSVIAFISGNDVVWFIFSLVNSLQGLFLLLLFTCRRRVLKQIREKMNLGSSYSDGTNTPSSNASNISSTN